MATCLVPAEREEETADLREKRGQLSRWIFFSKDSTDAKQSLVPAGWELVTVWSTLSHTVPDCTPVRSTLGVDGVLWAVAYQIDNSVPRDVPSGYVMLL